VGECYRVNGAFFLACQAVLPFILFNRRHQRSHVCPSKLIAPQAYGLKAYHARSHRRRCVREVADVSTNVNEHWQSPGLSLDRLDQWFPNKWFPQFSGQNSRADVTILVGIAREHSESFATVLGHLNSGEFIFRVGSGLRSLAAST
jgi:hypothetical protein